MDARTREKRVNQINQFIWFNLIILALTLIFSLGLAQIVVILLGLGYAIKLVLTPEKKFHLTYLDWAVLLFFGTRLLSIFISVDIMVSLGSLRKTPFFIITYFVVSRQLSEEAPEVVFKLFQYLIISAIIVSIYGIAKYLLGIEARVRSTGSGYTTLAIFLSAVFAFVLGTGIYFRWLKKKVYWFGILVLILVCLAFTFARAQWIATFVAVLVVGFIKNKKIIPITLGLVLILILVSPKIRDRVSTLANPLKHSSERTTIWKGAVSIFPERCWLGHGIGSFHQIFPFKDQMKDKKIGRWHNDYLQVFMESGLLGLIIFLHLIYAIFKTGMNAFKKWRMRENLLAQGMTFGILLALLTFFIQGFASGFLGDPISSILFWFLVGTLRGIFHYYNVLIKKLINDFFFQSAN